MPEMRVDQVEYRAYRVPLDRPEADGTLEWDATVVVTAHAAAGQFTGLGFTYAPAAVATFGREVLSDVVVGCDALRPSETWERQVRAIRNHGRPGISSMAIAATDISLWDLAARIRGLPLAGLLGAARDSVPVYGSGGFTSLTERELVEQLGNWVESGIPRVKMKIGKDRGRAECDDMARVQLARGAIGAGTELYVDANGAYSAKQARRVADRLAAFDVRWFEEPVSSDDLAGLADLRSSVPCEVAAGEYGYDLPYFSRMLTAEAVDVLQADVSRCAGITEWLRVAALAAAHGRELSGHCAPSLHLHPACAIPNLRHLEYFADHFRVDHILFDGVIDPVDGMLAPALDRPGLGLELRRPDADAHRVA